MVSLSQRMLLGAYGGAPSIRCARGTSRFVPRSITLSPRYRKWNSMLSASDVVARTARAGGICASRPAASSSAWSKTDELRGHSLSGDGPVIVWFKNDLRCGQHDIFRLTSCSSTVCAFSSSVPYFFPTMLLPTGSMITLLSMRPSRLAVQSSLC